MAYVDHAFSISDEDDLVGGAIGGRRGAPVKEIAFAAALLAFGALGAIGGLLMAVNRVGGDRAHGESEAAVPLPLVLPLPLPLSRFDASSSSPLPACASCNSHCFLPDLWGILAVKLGLSACGVRKSPPVSGVPGCDACNVALRTQRDTSDLVTFLISYLLGCQRASIWVGCLVAYVWGWD